MGIGMDQSGTLYGYAIISNNKIEYCSDNINRITEEFGYKWITVWETERLPVFLPLSTNVAVTIDVLQDDKYIAIFQDLTEWNAFNESIRDLESIFNDSHDGIYVTDGKGNTIRINPGSERNYGINSKDLINKSVFDLEKEGVFRPSVVGKVLKEKKRITAYQETKIGKIILATGNPIFNEENEIIRVICNSRDITELHQLKEQLSQYEEKMVRYESELIQLRQKETKIEGFIANSKEMRNILSLVNRVSTVDSNIFITGESGTGKGIIAKAVHSLSARSKGPFIKVNCGAIPENLLESELFGYEPGAFTGARKEGKLGYFELADQGTLFLDEIGELTLSLQVKLLQSIQDKSIERVGGTKTIPVDFRLVTATNRNVNEMVKKGQFREDLFYRLSVIPIEIPPLRGRKEDIPFLVQFFFEQMNNKNKTNKHLDPKAVDLLCRYEWPGNVRQLENVVERLVVLSQNEYISQKELIDLLDGFFSDLEDHHTVKVTNNCDSKLNIQSLDEDGCNLPKILKDIEKQMIEEALIKFKTTRKTAKYLKMSQPTLVRRIKELNISKR